MIRNILVVCTGNICRSPLAEALLRARLPECGVTSAGVGALVGRPVEAHAAAVAEAAGLDLSAHRARQITLEMATAQDLLLMMDAGHLAWVNQRYPELRGRSFLLGHWQAKRDVPDPYQQPRAAFERAFALIQEDAAKWVERLQGMG